MALNLRGRIGKLEVRGTASEQTAMFWAVIDGRANVNEVTDPEMRATLLKLFRPRDPNRLDPIEEAIRLATLSDGQVSPLPGREPG